MRNRLGVSASSSTHVGRSPMPEPAGVLYLKSDHEGIRKEIKKILYKPDQQKSRMIYNVLMPKQEKTNRGYGHPY